MTSNSIILTFWIHCCINVQDEILVEKWQNILEFDEILAAMNSLVSYAFNYKNKMGWQCSWFNRMNIYFYAMELLRWMLKVKIAELYFMALRLETGASICLALTVHLIRKTSRCGEKEFLKCLGWGKSLCFQSQSILMSLTTMEF